VGRGLIAKVGSYGNKGSGLTGSLKRDIRLDSGLGTHLYWILVHVRNMYNVYIYIYNYIYFFSLFDFIYVFNTNQCIDILEKLFALHMHKINID
jgi:hypothetical protein